MLIIIIYLLIILILTPIIGAYLFKVFTDSSFFGKKLFSNFEHRIYAFIGVDPLKEQTWKSYLISLLVFNLLGFTLLFLILVFQGYLPMNPQGLKCVEWHLALNIATSFVTNTNWQSYAGETTLSNFSQMVGLTVQNFMSAATGIGVLLALARSFTKKSVQTLGNFWVDSTRATIYVFLPLSILLAIGLVSQGVVQTFQANLPVETIMGSTQELPLGPAASQIAIKQLGTNGGGFYNANSAHPFENPTPFSNLLQMLAILIIPAALTITYGKIVGSYKHGIVVFGVMMFLLICGIAVSWYAENDLAHTWGGLANFEGKELRLGIDNSVLWSLITTAASNGSVNCMHSSLAPLAGLVAMFNIMLGEVVFGGVGSGLYGMILFIIITVFIAGLMVGRTPEYLGKKIESFEVQMAMVAVLSPSVVILAFSALAIQTTAGTSSLLSHGPHALSEIVYAFTSAAGNNGSAFAGLNANTAFYNVLLALAMAIGRFGVIVPVMALAGSMVKKKSTPVSLGTFKTDNLLFACLLLAVMMVVGGLTFFPVLALGPVVEHIGLSTSILF